ncbi:DUF4254 domain-containing protein [Nocardia sp. CA-107356]|uniref:DUF4254 domain-containing protein n=1 Tax=Nocardia sp. CA-107356 TaxID=3239972 RepID=UPI003D935635
MRSGFLVVEGSAARLTLPDWHALLAAFRGARGVLPGDHLVLRWAGSLAHVHRIRQVRPDRGARIDRRRSELVELITNWVDTHIQPRTTSAERVGRAVDDLAAAYVGAELVLAAAENASDPSVHEAWIEASVLAVAWADLVAEVVDGQPPMPWPVGHFPPQ